MYVFIFETDHNLPATNNGLSLPQTEKAQLCPLQSEHQTVEKIKLGRQDQGDNDTGETFIHSSYFTCCAFGCKISDGAKL